jgi:hypothetical protein
MAHTADLLDITTASTPNHLNQNLCDTLALYADYLTEAVAKTALLKRMLTRTNERTSKPLVDLAPSLVSNTLQRKHCSDIIIPAQLPTLHQPNKAGNTSLQYPQDTMRNLVPSQRKHLDRLV